MVSDAGGKVKHCWRIETQLTAPALEEIQVNAQETKVKVESAQTDPQSETKLPAMVWLPDGDYARGSRTLPREMEGPDFARGLRTLPREAEGPDYARGLRTLPRGAERPDFARGLRHN